ncbi:MAG: SIMPL domain-containing protein [Gammaproteobacteria bacterium]|jgi:predicted secreted protein|nr:SIMPL domain-containing protein [Gammaproteobacteria bacterium]
MLPRGFCFGCVLAVTGLVATVAQAHEPAVFFDRVQLQASAEREVDRDRVRATLFSQVESENAADAAAKVNSSIRWALDQAREGGFDEVETGGYSTSPVYSRENGRNELRAWRVRQELRILSGDPEKLTGLLGRLQKRVDLGGVQYLLSVTEREKVEAQLMQDAMRKFEARADIVRQHFGRPGYRLVELHFNESGAAPQAVRYALAQRSADAEAAPALEAGRETVRVSLSGVIELKPAGR